MKKRVDQRFDYRVSSNRIPAHCRLRIYGGAGATVVIMSQAPDSEGMSVTNAAEELATQIAQSFDLLGAATTWVEHWPEDAYRSDDFVETFDLVEFTWSNGTASHPRWRRMAGEEVERMVGEEA